MELSPFFYTYITAWITACLIALVLAVQDKNSILLFQKRYFDFLLVKWKFITFFIATSAFVFLAPYTGDPTWDYYDAAFMSILTYLTAPWCVGVLYRFLKRQEKSRMAYIAICAWLFSASWSYDIYLVFRDGYYPVTWSSNIIASSVLYISAGLFWNLEYNRERGVIFGFMNDSWPDVDAEAKFNRILLYALPFIILAAAIFIPFLT